MLYSEMLAKDTQKNGELYWYMHPAGLGYLLGHRFKNRQLPFIEWRIRWDNRREKYDVLRLEWALTGDGLYEWISEMHWYVPADSTLNYWYREYRRDFRKRNHHYPDLD